MIYIFWTCKELSEAKKITSTLLSKRWVACANIIPQIISLYTWKEGLQEENEVKVIFKTLPHFFEKVSQYIQENCSYEIAEISKVNIDECSPSYLKWVNNMCD